MDTLANLPTGWSSLDDSADDDSIEEPIISPVRTVLEKITRSSRHALPDSPIAPEPPKSPVGSTGTKKSPKSVWQLPCHSLSRLACEREPFRCLYDDEKRLCGPARVGWGEKYAVQWFGSRQLWRSKVISLFDRAGNNCNIESNVKNIRVFTSKESASQSIIVAGTIEPTAIDKSRSPDSNIIYKITYNAKDVVDNSLQVEIAIYRNIITRLVNNRNTPHVTSYLGFQTCGIEIGLPVGQFGAYFDQLENIDNELYDTTRANLLITERSSGIEFSKWLNKETTLRDLLSIIFQILYTLNCFARIGLQHNDLHDRNIFIEDMGQPLTLFYKRGPNQYVELTTRYIAKIYDWDRGSILHPAVPSNLELTKYYCRKYGTCEHYSPKFDLFEFIAILHQRGLNNVDSSIKATVKQWIIKILDWGWYSKIYEREISHTLAYLELPTDVQFKPVKDALRIFVDYPWIEPPFIVKSGTGDDLPLEIFFQPPQERIRVQEMWNPVTDVTHQSRDIAPESYEEYDPFISPVLKTWEDELKLDHHSLSKYGDKLAKEISKKIMREFTTEEGDVYNHACWWLCLYQFHRLSLAEQKSLIEFPVISDTIDNIWNMFDNRLPIAIPRYIMMGPSRAP
jgi:serine/threonine protein kinase